jgi:predicted phage tail component-like protein
MSGSLSFGGVALSTYGLIVLNTTKHPMLPPPRLRQAKLTGKSGAYDFDAEYEPREFICGVHITGTTLADLQSKMDSIAAVLDVQLGVQQLIFDIQSTRYFMAKLAAAPDFAPEGFSAEGQLRFICADPFAYSTTETDSDHTVDEDPETLYETPGGNGYVEPVWTLTADADLGAVTITITNGTTAEAFSWTGTINTGEVLVIDSALWHVTLEGVASQTAISGAFPRLKGGVKNTITVTGFSGNLNVTYRARYL